MFILYKTTVDLAYSDIESEYEELTLSSLEEYVLSSYDKIDIIKDPTNSPIKVNILRDLYSVKFLVCQYIIFHHNLKLVMEYIYTQM